MAYSSLKPEITKDPELKKIIADQRKDVRDSIHVFWKKMNIIMNETQELTDISLKMIQVQAGLNGNNPEWYMRNYHQDILNTLMVWEEIPGFDQLFDNYIDIVSKTWRKPDIFRLEIFSKNETEFYVYTISKIDRKVYVETRLKNPSYSWRYHRDLDARKRK